VHLLLFFVEVVREADLHRIASTTQSTDGGFLLFPCLRQSRRKLIGQLVEQFLLQKD
jgi:hypothetical protein